MNSLEQFVLPELLEELMEFSSVVSLLSGISGMLISLATYIAVSLSLYTIANRRHIKHAWLAWIPVGNVWILGSISDHYQLVAQYRTKNKRKLLMFLQILQTILCVITLVICCVTVLSVLRAYEDIEYGYFIDIWAPVRNSLQEMIAVFVVLIAATIWSAVVQYIARYDLYRSCDPANAALYLVLSIVIPITEPIFMLLCCNKDDGIPKPQNPTAFWQPSESPAEPWDQNGM